MPVRSVKNQYHGINAHLHSQLQAKGGWESFHTNHISDLTKLMREGLRPLGYTADTEQSLQIRRIGEDPRYPEADVTIFDPDELRAKLPPIPLKTTNTSELVLPIAAMLGIPEVELKQIRAIGIYQVIDDARTEQGDPVAWVELLSPSNKPGGQHFYDYRQKRLKVLQSGIVFVEIDYLHEYPPTFDGVGDYRDPRQTEAHPYRIAVTDPRPFFWEGEAHVWQFDVDEAIPQLPIPLNASDILEFDFNRPYQKTFEEMYYGDVIDYSRLPEHFSAYSLADQTRIVRRMMTVLDAAQTNQDLENTPLPLSRPELSLADGLAILS